MSRENTSRFQLRLPSSLKEQIRSKAKSDDVSMNDVVLAAVRDHFAEDDYKTVSLNYLAQIDRKHANILKRLDTLLDAIGLFIRLWFQHNPEIQDPERMKQLGRQAKDRWEGFLEKLQNMLEGEQSLRKAFESDVARPEDSTFGEG